jgi:hypothetical protein
MDLPFAEPIETFTRRHAQALARTRGATTTDSPATPGGRSPRAKNPRRGAARQQA